MELVSNFFNYEYQEGHDVSGHITVIELLGNELNDIGSPISIRRPKDVYGRKCVFRV